ncbi:MAG: protein O-mannosyl-transferase family [Chthoniobacterales bacterium]
MLQKPCSYFSNSENPLTSFSQGDRKLALFCFFIALATFWFTAMPNIGLGDDGEMATAALHFGVPHPSGYPLWTILAGLFSKLCFVGNGAWKLNLFSGLCAATAVAIFALLARSTARWLGLDSLSATLLALACTMTFAWSAPIWSQATIGKGTYSLHVLLMITLAGLCYLWIRMPSWKNAFVWIVFNFSLGMSNHHMTLAMAALPLLVILLLHGDLFWEYTIYSLLIGSGLYLGFAYLSQLPAVMSAAVRLSYTVILAFLIFLLIKKKLREWKRGLLLIIAVILGLLPYLYMPIASSTNPPMNWSYTSTRAGFFYAINRSQYWGTLADQLQGTIGKAMGVPPLPKPAAQKNQNEESALCAFLGFFRRFFEALAKNISPLPLLGVLAACSLCYWRSKEQRIWLILLGVGFLLSAFFEPIMAPNGYDNPGWDMQKPWQGLCYGFFLLGTCYGTASAFLALQRRSVLITDGNKGENKVFSRLKLFFLAKAKSEEQCHHSDSSDNESRNNKSKQKTLIPIRYEYKKGAWSLIVIAGLVAIYTFCSGLPQGSQRAHWFGWMYGHDMLSDLPRDSFIFGGTDPGRFVPTFMVFGESFEKPSDKRDPNFDRRDLYIVTQNALADHLYNQYIRSQYSNERPVTFNWFERLLGRDHTYPKATLILPHNEDVITAFNACLREFQKNPSGLNPQTNPGVLNSAIAEWIFLRNRDRHHFFVEESFPMPWSYPYAIPHGLCYEINHDPLPTLSPAIVAKDTKFWTEYIEKLKKVNGFKNDDLARHCFAKLRNTTGNIYASRGMRKEAEFAYKQALELWPGNSETTENIANILEQEGRFDEASTYVNEALLLDPNSKLIQRLKEVTDSRCKARKEIPLIQQELNDDPTNRTLLGKEMQAFLILGQEQAVDQLINNAIMATPKDIGFLRDMINYYATRNRISKALEVAQRLKAVQPKQWDVPFTISKYQFFLGQENEAIASLQQAVALGGSVAQQAIMHEQIFQQLQNSPQFQELMHFKK